MKYYAFNIGKPHIDAWWTRNQVLGLITAGYTGKPGDRGEVLLNQMTEGDWVLGFSNGHGFVGAGKVGPASTYRLLSTEQLPSGWEATHRHIRKVDWIHAVASLVEAVPAREVGRNSPRQTKERLPENAALRLIEILAGKTQKTVVYQTLPQFAQAFAEKVEKSKNDSRSARLLRLQQAPKLPSKVPVLTHEFVRNPDVVAEVLYRATNCGRCNSPAPFLRRSDGTPYLEVHHKKPLSENGEDTVANAIALCPNCHREFHHGQSAV